MINFRSFLPLIFSAEHEFVYLTSRWWQWPVATERLRRYMAPGESMA
jgi:hypothetical protein